MRPAIATVPITILLGMVVLRICPENPSGGNSFRNNPVSGHAQAAECWPRGASLRYCRASSRADSMDAIFHSDGAADSSANGVAPAIAVNGLVKRYGQVHAVEGISFTVARGSFTALLGGNGAGKTTTIAILLGLVRPTAGRVEILGQDFARHAKTL